MDKPELDHEIFIEIPDRSVEQYLMRLFKKHIRDNYYIAYAIQLPRKTELLDKMWLFKLTRHYITKSDK